VSGRAIKAKCLYSILDNKAGCRGRKSLSCIQGTNLTGFTYLSVIGKVAVNATTTKIHTQKQQMEK